MLGFGFVASLAIIWVTHNYRKFKISVAIPKERTLPHSLIQSEKHYSIIKLLNKFTLSTSNSIILSPPSSFSRVKELTFGIQIYGTFK